MAAVVLFWGLNFSVSKLAFGDLPPLAFTAIRFAIGSALYLWALARRGPLRLPPPGTLGALLVLGLAGNTLYQFGFILGLARTSATNAALLLAAMPTVVTLLASLTGIEQVSVRQRVGIALATSGVVLVLVARGGGLSLAARAGDLLILGAVLFWSAYTLGVRRLRGRLSALDITAWTTFTGTPGLILLGMPDLLRLDWGTVHATAWAALAYSASLSLVVAYLLWNRGVALLGVARAAAWSCATPLVAAVAAMVLLGERPTLAHVLGALGIVGGVLLAQLGGAARGPAPPPQAASAGRA